MKTNPHLNGKPTHVPRQSHATPKYQPAKIGALAAHALTFSLANPYGSTSTNQYTNANYHTYFTQPQNLETTTQGYTLSSTYRPSPVDSDCRPTSWHHAQGGRPQAPRLGVSNFFSRQSGADAFSIPGDVRCTHAGCSFTGSTKAVEIHMMDRHLIFPLGWKKRKNDWDADPSLKGKLVPIPGTGVLLNTPEAIDAWVAERRKKWPTKQRVVDKERKTQEALDRGEINPSELTANGRKRRRVDAECPENSARGSIGGRGRGKGRGRDRGRGRGRGDLQGGKVDSGWQRRDQSNSRAHVRSEPGADATRTGHRHATLKPASSQGETSDSDPDMDPVKDAISSKAPDIESDAGIVEDLRDASQQIIHNDNIPVDERLTSGHSPSTQRSYQVRRPRPAKPRAPSNPFASRPSLLRSLLLPEIRHTISNISQAIHFLVENDFLEGVELKPGDSDSQKIKVLTSTSTGAHPDMPNI